MGNKELTSKELALINNIICKLQIHMDKTNQTLHSLANNLGFDYQPFYRLVRNKKLPTISTLAMITEHLQCSISDLISENILVDVSLINSFKEIILPNKTNIIKIQVPIVEYTPYIHYDFYAIKLDTPNQFGVSSAKIYVTNNQINSDGIFIVKYQDKIIELNVSSVSSRFIIAEVSNKEQRILQTELQPIAKFFNDLILCEASKSYIYGVK